jgi:hypothetical protein
MKRHPAVAATLALLLLFFSVGQATAQENLPRLVKKIQPAVVTIIAYDKQGKVIGQGSGFFISLDGRFLTNYHVLAGANRALVKTANGRRYPVERIVAEDKDGDLVVAAVEAPRGGFPSLELSGVLPEVGEKVAVVGSPLGLEQTLSDGVVSAIRWVKGLGEILQITAPISPGSSGSPVVNMKGEVVGVATLQIVKGQNLNFAVPGSRALALKTGKRRPHNEWAGPAVPISEAGDLFLQGLELSKGGKLKEAIEAYKQAIRLQPDYAEAHYLLSYTYVLLGRDREAVAAYQQAIRLQPHDAWVHLNLGFTYIVLGDRGAAMEQYKILQTLDPKKAKELFDFIYR